MASRSSRWMGRVASAFRQRACVASAFRKAGGVDLPPKGGIHGCLYLVVAIAITPLVAQAPLPQDRDRAAAAAKRTEDRLRALQREADALAAQERTVLVDLRKLEVERQISVEQLARIERDR